MFMSLTYNDIYVSYFDISCVVLIAVRRQDVLGSISEQLRHGTRWGRMGVAAEVSWEQRPVQRSVLARFYSWSLGTDSITVPLSEDYVWPSINVYKCIEEEFELLH